MKTAKTKAPPPSCSELDLTLGSPIGRSRPQVVFCLPSAGRKIRGFGFTQDYQMYITFALNRATNDDQDVRKMSGNVGYLGKIYQWIYTVQLN